MSDRLACQYVLVQAGPVLQIHTKHTLNNASLTHKHLSQIPSKTLVSWRNTHSHTHTHKHISQIPSKTLVSWRNTHSHTHTHKHTHTHTHTRTHTHTHTHKHTHT